MILTKDSDGPSFGRTGRSDDSDGREVVASEDMFDSPSRSLISNR